MRTPKQLAWLLSEQAVSADYLSANLNADQNARDFIKGCADLMREAAAVLEKLRLDAAK